jgi:hypothetical protein
MSRPDFQRWKSISSGMALAISVLWSSGAKPEEFPQVPRDADMIAAFLAHKSEFEVWQKQLLAKDNNCLIHRSGRVVWFESFPCAIGSMDALTKFMLDNGIAGITATRSLYGRDGRRGAQFRIFVSGGEQKSIEYGPGWDGPLEKDLDQYSWKGSTKASDLQEGFWMRAIEGDWFLSFAAYQ